MACRIATSQEMDAVYRLTHDQYVMMGYCQPQPDKRLIHYPHLENIPETTVLVALDEEGTIIGTNSITIDGPAGLHVDEDFPEEVARVRQTAQDRGHLLAASWRIVTAPTVKSSLQVIMTLVKKTMEEVCRLRIQENLFSFNPRHGRIYQKLIGLQTIAKGKCDAVSGAPGILMYANTPHMIASWKKTCTRRNIPFDCDTWWLSSKGQQYATGKDEQERTH